MQGLGDGLCVSRAILPTLSTRWSNCHQPAGYLFLLDLFHFCADLDAEALHPAGRVQYSDGSVPGILSSKDESVHFRKERDQGELNEMSYKPTWFTDRSVFVSFADTCGINKDGNTLFAVDPMTGKRTD